MTGRKESRGAVLWQLGPLAMCWSVRLICSLSGVAVVAGRRPTSVGLGSGGGSTRCPSS